MWKCSGGGVNIYTRHSNFRVDVLQKYHSRPYQYYFKVRWQIWKLLPHVYINKQANGVATFGPIHFHQCSIIILQHWDPFSSGSRPLEREKKETIMSVQIISHAANLFSFFSSCLFSCLASSDCRSSVIFQLPWQSGMLPLSFLSNPHGAVAVWINSSQDASLFEEVRLYQRRDSHVVGHWQCCCNFASVHCHSGFEMTHSECD